jgi:GTP:adenosylcobinamide-phosphate guanylyltransferase
MKIAAKRSTGIIALSADLGLLMDDFINLYTAAAKAATIAAANNIYVHKKTASVKRGTCIASPAVLSMVPAPNPNVAKNAINSKKEITTIDIPNILTVFNIIYFI